MRPAHDTEVRAALRRRPRRRRLLLVLVAILAVAIAILAMLWSRAAAFNDRVSSAGAASSALLLPLAFGSDPVNVLMLGYGGPQHEGPFLTDSINLISIDPAMDTTTIIPIPRDLWIEGLPAILPDNGKLNEVFAQGVAEDDLQTGGSRAAEAVSTVTGLQVEHWLAIDFNGFEAMVDGVGGVTIDNPTEFSYGSPTDLETGEWDASFPAGPLRLTGEQALFYARTRYTSDPAQSSDFARSVRQQRIMSAIVSEVGGFGPGSIGPGLTLMDALAEHLDTNLSVVDLGLLAQNIEPDRRIELKEGEILEATTNSAGQYVLVVIGRTTPSDYAPLHDHVEELTERPLASPSPSSPPPSGPDPTVCETCAPP